MENNTIINYIISLGLSMREADYIINNGYTFEDTVKTLDECDKEMDFDEF